MGPKLVALGSSFASGPGLKPYKSTEAMRSERNYASLLAKHLDADLIDLTSGGSTLLNIIEEPQGSLPPQIEGIPADADIITITSGGNDMAYVGRIALESAAASWLTWPLAKLYQGRIRDNDMDEEKLVARFRDVIAQVRRRAPQAQIILVEYLTLIGSDYRPDIDGPLNTEQAAAAQQRAAMLQRVYAKAVERQDRCGVLPVAERSMKHGVGSQEPWVTGYNLGMMFGGSTPWHPNALGMEEVAKMLLTYLQNQLQNE
jgi:lysophospholipase L1-like esterase